MQSTCGTADTYGNASVLWRQFPKPFEKYNGGSTPYLRHVSAPGALATSEQNEKHNSRRNGGDGGYFSPLPSIDAFEGDDNGGTGNASSGSGSDVAADDDNNNSNNNHRGSDLLPKLDRPSALNRNFNGALEKRLPSSTRSDVVQETYNSDDVVRFEVTSLETDVTSLPSSPSFQNGGLYVRPIDKSSIVVERGAFYSAFQKGVRKVMGVQDGDSLRCGDLKFNNDWDECDGSFESWQRRLVQRARLLKEPAVKKMVSTSKTVRDHKPRSDGDAWRLNAQAELEELKRKANKQWISLQNDALPSNAIIRERYDMQNQQDSVPPLVGASLFASAAPKVIRHSLGDGDVSPKNVVGGVENSLLPVTPHNATSTLVAPGGNDLSPDSPTSGSTSGCSCTSCSSSVLWPFPNIIDNPSPPSSLIDHPPGAVFGPVTATATLGLSVCFSDERKLSVVFEDDSPPSSSSSSKADSLLLSSDGDDSVLASDSDDDLAATEERSKSQFMNARPSQRPLTEEKMRSFTTAKIRHVTAALTPEDKTPDAGNKSSDGKSVPSSPLSITVSSKKAAGSQITSDHPLTKVARGSPTPKEPTKPSQQPTPTVQAKRAAEEPRAPAPNQHPQSVEVTPTTTTIPAVSGAAETTTEEGVWSPGKASPQHPSASRSCPSLSEAASKAERVPSSQDDSSTPIPPVWKPFGQGHSNAEQPHFRSIRLDKMTLKENQGQPQSTASVTTPTPPPPPSSESVASWHTTQTQVYSRVQTLEQTSSSSSTTSTTTATTTITTPTTQTSPPSGPPSQLSPPFTRLNGSSNLPRSQSPTITLLQKAREGQIPRGASYIEQKPADTTPLSSSFPRVNDSLFRVKSAEIHDNYRKVHLEPIKHQGIGPTTPQGLPIGLRTGIKEENKGEWYKKMYKSLHRLGDSSEDDFIMVKYRHRGRIPYSTTGYMSEPEPERDALRTYSKYATLDRRRPRFDEFVDHRNRTMPPTKSKSANQPKKIEDYEPGHSSIAEREAKLDEEVEKVTPDIQPMATLPPTIPSTHGSRHNPQLDRPAPSYVFKDGYESDSTLVYHKHGSERPDPMDQRLWYREIQRGGDIPLAGFRRPAPDRPKDSSLPSPTATPLRRLTRSWSTESAPVPLDLSMLPPVPAPPPKVPLVDFSESPHRYNETQVNIHYKAPIRELEKEYIEEEELRVKQEEMMKQFYEQERRKKYLQELNDIENRRHSDNFTPGQKSPIPLNRYDQFDGPTSPQPRTKTPEPKTVARARYKFVAQSARELSFNKGDIIYVTRRIDKNWFEGEHHGMIGLFPVNYVEIIPHDSMRITPKKLTEGLAKAKYHFRAQTSLELPLAKGELIVLTRRVDHNWYMGRIGGREGIVPVSYVEVMREPGDSSLKSTSPTPKPLASPVSRTMIVNGSASSPHTQSYNPPSYYNQKLNTYQSPYATMRRYVPNRPPEPTYAEKKQPVNQSLHIDTHSEPVPYRALYDYQPQNEDELELREGDTVFVMEKCDDGWYVGSSLRTGFFGTFPGNYVERL